MLGDAEVPNGPRDRLLLVYISGCQPAIMDCIVIIMTFDFSTCSTTQLNCHGDDDIDPMFAMWKLAVRVALSLSKKLNICLVSARTQSHENNNSENRISPKNWLNCTSAHELVIYNCPKVLNDH